MRAPSFWWRSAAPAALLLAPFGWLYGLFSASRMRKAGEPAAKPVICIGNFVMGGGGKTPLCLAIGRLAIQNGLKPGFLSRGYGGSETGPVRVDPRKHMASDVGDEPLLLAALAPTVVAQDRVAGAKALERLGVDLVVMDDGFQNPGLSKDLSIVVVDGARGLGNGFVFPAGPLRAPLGVQLERADAVLVMGPGAPGEAAAQKARARGLPVFAAELVPLKSDGWDEAPLLAFAGIAAPERFFASLEAAGATLGAWRAFGDHHRWSEEDCHALLDLADEKDLLPVTTEKDAARLKGTHGAHAALYQRLAVFPVRARIADEAGFWGWIAGRLSERKKMP
ncbi:tetraacyldisaccharide 4'-kinase [Afifella sp. IM 167]|uniref:tetraacyldisaccharide 4'-kinase n=1 Tax=Afifella sp. IM 167 TaxID=2033586 RepID=UPI001CCF633A|nr:tetraacyldisaccharide 4'-kinase [Afifella sp. IM 167]MBZ8133462.1 tetraacyldisaccharide 4'-kinase [Afifella sp. IM 167]